MTLAHHHATIFFCPPSHPPHKARLLQGKPTDSRGGYEQKNKSNTTLYGYQGKFKLELYPFLSSLHVGSCSSVMHLTCMYGNARKEKSDLKDVWGEGKQFLLYIVSSLECVVIFIVHYGEKTKTSTRYACYHRVSSMCQYAGRGISRCPADARRAYPAILFYCTFGKPLLSLAATAPAYAAAAAAASCLLVLLRQTFGTPDASLSDFPADKTILAAVASSLVFCFPAS